MLYKFSLNINNAMRECIEISHRNDSLERQKAGLKQQGTHSAHFGLLFNKDLEVLIDDGDSQ